MDFLKTGKPDEIKIIGNNTFKWDDVKRAWRQEIQEIPDQIELPDNLISNLQTNSSEIVENIWVGNQESFDNIPSTDISDNVIYFVTD